jgi:hypothetical protein
MFVSERGFPTVGLFVPAGAERHEVTDAAARHDPDCRDPISVIVF